MTQCDNPHCDDSAVLPVIGDDGERLAYACSYRCGDVATGQQATL